MLRASLLCAGWSLLLAAPAPSGVVVSKGPSSRTARIVRRRRLDETDSECASVDWDETKTRTWPDAEHSHDSNGAVDIVTAGGSFGQLTVEITTWQPFEQVTLQLPSATQFQVRSAWSATLVAMDDEEVTPDEEEMFNREPGHNEPWWDTMRNVRKVTFEIGCQPTTDAGVENEDANGVTYVGTFGVILHTPTSSDVMDIDPDADEHPLAPGEDSYGGEEGERGAEGDAPVMDLSDVSLQCTDPPTLGDDELNRESTQCEDEMGGATLRLVNAWDPAGAADQGEREMPNVKGFYGEVDIGDWKAGTDIFLSPPSHFPVATCYGICPPPHHTMPLCAMWQVWTSSCASPA